MLVPAGVHQLDVAGSTFEKTSGEETITGKGAGFVDLRAVEIESGLGLARNIGEFGHAGLHAVGHFVLRDPGLNFRISDGRVFIFVECGNAIEHLTAERGAHSLWIVEVENGI